MIVTEKLEGIRRRQEEILLELQSPETQNDTRRFAALLREQAQLTPITDGKISGQKTLSEVFTMKLEGDSARPGTNHFRDSWVLLNGGKQSADGKNKDYLFGYSRRIQKGQTTDALFDKVQLVNFREEEIGAKDSLSIGIRTFAIQADSILDGETQVNTDGTIGKETLEKIYEIYALQNDRT